MQGHTSHIHTCLVTNAMIYSFHNKLKTNPRYMNHHVNRRCDDLIQILLTIEEDVFFERMRKEVILSPQDASMKTEGKERHSRCRNITDSNVTVRNLKQTIAIT